MDQITALEPGDVVTMTAYDGAGHVDAVVDLNGQPHITVDGSTTAHHTDYVNTVTRDGVTYQRPPWSPWSSWDALADRPPFTRA